MGIGAANVRGLGLGLWLWWGLGLVPRLGPGLPRALMVREWQRLALWPDRGLTVGLGLGLGGRQ